jgi:DNA modification methylase
VKHFGNIPPEILDNLLYYYTEPFCVVFDPFAGGGMTIDVCKNRLRRYYVSDLSPIPARGNEIRQWDITQGFPDDLPVPDLVFLDPPYWKQAKGKYSGSPNDLSNMELEAFLETIGNIAKWTKRKWRDSRPNGKLAIIIGILKEDGKFIDLPFFCYQVIEKYLKMDVRIQVPYSTEIHGGAFVNLAKERKEMLYLSRDLMIFGSS